MLNIVPNPVTQYIQLSDEVVSYKILTPTGTSIPNEELQIINNQLQVSELQNGLYLLQVIYADGSVHMGRFKKE